MHTLYGELSEESIKQLNYDLITNGYNLCLSKISELCAKYPNEIYLGLVRDLLFAERESNIMKHIKQK